jgi:hypothetical protein
MRVAAWMAAVFWGVVACAESPQYPGLREVVGVRSGGEICIVRGKDEPCKDVPSILTSRLGLALGTPLTVGAEACGAQAVGEALAVAHLLKSAGFTRVVTIGFITEPGRSCTSCHRSA